MSLYRPYRRTSNVPLIVTLLIILILIGSMIMRLTGNFSYVYSEGERVGLVNKLSHKGFFCKTWEGEMNLGGFRNKTTTDKDGNTSTSVVANLFEFTISDPIVVEQVQQAMESGEITGLKYEERGMYSPCESSTGYFIVGVKK